MGAPTISAPVVYQDYSGSPPAWKSPYVQVSTKTQVHMPCSLLQVCGEAFRDGMVTFNQTYTFPIVRVK